MKPKEVQKKLNMLCPGLGDAWIKNCYDLDCQTSKIQWSSFLTFESLSRAISEAFSWTRTNEGDIFWDEIQSMIIEMEQAELI